MMPKKYRIDRIEDITTISFTAAPTFDEAKEVIGVLKEKNIYHLRLWDFSSVLFDFDTEEIQQIANYGKLTFTEKNRIAMVAPQDSAYGTLRMFEVYREQNSFSIARVFRTKAEAMQWLEEQKVLLASEPV